MDHPAGGRGGPAFDRRSLPSGSRLPVAAPPGLFLATARAPSTRARRAESAPVAANRLAGNKKKCQQVRGTLLFLDESDFSLTPYVAKTWAPRAHTPVVRHCFNWPKLSALSAVGLRGQCYFRLHCGSVRYQQVISFLPQLLRHTCRPLFILWDSVGPHRAASVQRIIATHPRLPVFPLPAYCPELNPDEWFWSHLKCRQLANLGPWDVEQLKHEIRKAVRRIRRRPGLVHSFYKASGFVRYLCRNH